MKFCKKLEENVEYFNVKLGVGLHKHRVVL